MSDEKSKQVKQSGEVHPVAFSVPDAERGVLSAVLQAPERWLATARSRIPGPEVFTSLANRAVWEVTLEMEAAAKPIDSISVMEVLRSRGDLEKIGGPVVVSELFTLLTVTGHVEHYLGRLLEKYYLRRLREMGQRIRDLAEAAAAESAVARPVAEVVAEAENEVFHLLQEVESGAETEGPKPTSEGVVQWCEVIEQTMRAREDGGVKGIKTGIHEIDLTFNGFDDGEGELVVIAGRPGQGKTAMACTLLQRFGEEKVPGLFFSAEMSANQIYTRLVLGGAKIDMGKAFTGHFSAGDQQVIGTQTRKIMQWPMWIDDSARITSADIRLRTQLLKRTAGIRWIVVDHLHKIRGVEKGSEEERIRLVEVSETLRFLKKELGLVVFELVQLNRESDRQAGKPPTLADLSGSAAIEQDADHVIFIHRPSYFVGWDRLPDTARSSWESLVMPRRKRSPDLWSLGDKYEEEMGGPARQDYEEDAILYVRKNRRGPTPDLHVRFEAEQGKFSTRMPKVQSKNVLDWQIGTYQPEPLRKAESGGGGRRWSRVGDDE